MTRRIRILQAGLGDWGRDWAWRVNPTVDEAEVVGYVDSDPPALALLAKRLPVSRGRCFGSLADGIQATQPDALLVTTTLAGHAPLVRAGLEAGLHVLVEQPFLVDMSIHHFDLLRLVLGREPDRALCVTANAGIGGFDGPPTAAASIFFGDILVSYRASWISARAKTPWAGEWTMEFENGYV